MTLPQSSEARTTALLDERSAALARRGGARSSAETGTAYLVCTCGSERYGLPLADIAAVMAGRPCTPLPGAPSALAGIVALSGAIVSVIDLARALGSERGDQTAEPGHLVRLRAADPLVALAVDRVIGIAHVASSASVTGAEADRDADELSGFGVDMVSRYAPPGPGAAALAEGGFSIVDLPRLLRRLTS